MSNGSNPKTVSETDIAIVGMAAHLPGAPSIDTFWNNLKSGISAIKKINEQDLLDAGESRARLHHKNYVPFAAQLDGFDQFDAEFFGLSPKEAAIMDPQHRKFLEVAWEALENAGHPPEKFDGPIGAFGGCGMGSYFYFNICSNPDLVDDVGMFLLRHTGNDKDFLTTRLSHILDLKGPSINVQTACSTSLVATHYACQALLNGECNMALAGGVTIELPQGRGYVFEDGEILSPDGECHAFDHRAQGTVFGSGAGVIVLRRLSDALEDGDHIWGVIKGTAINNDGADKAGYLAPSVNGQAAAIAEAQAISDVRAESVDYIECHGTGTFLGDPIELAALTTAFRETTDATGFCRIGSVKTNIGHLDTAAGVASLIKTSLSLYHKQIPPSLGFEAPNPAIDFDNSPFTVNAELAEWPSRETPRRAGVNSLGVGGTNAHVVLEEAPLQATSEASDWPFHLLTVTGRNRAALDANAKNLAAHLRAHPHQNLADIAFTLQEGRRAFEKRRVVVADSHEQAAEFLETPNPRRVFDHSPAGLAPDNVFMFPGGGSQYAGMAGDLYETEPVFQEWMDRGLAILLPQLDYDIRALWMPDDTDVKAADETLNKPSAQLPLIMITEYALAQLFMSWGVEPTALIGHSMGENTAACLAGILSFEDCIGLVLLRGKLFDTMPAGGMLSVALSKANVTPYLGDKLDIAGLNAPELTVVSGPQSALDDLEKTLKKQDIECQRVAIDIAAHSRMLDSILDRFRDYLKGIELSPPSIPLISNRSGDWITDVEATDPDYWVRHLRGAIHFADGISTLSAQNPDRIYLEMGPGKALSALTRMHGDVPGQQVLSVLRHRDEEIADDIYHLETLGRISALGGAIDWLQIWGDAKRHRVPLPTYAFQRSRYFIEPGEANARDELPFLEKTENLGEWGYRPTWKPEYADCDVDVDRVLKEGEKHNWLVLSDRAGMAATLIERLRNSGHSVSELRAGDRFSRLNADTYTLAPEHGRDGYDSLVQDLIANGKSPDRIVSFWLADASDQVRAGSSLLHRNLEQGFYSMLFLAQAISDENLATPIHITAISNGAVSINDEVLQHPDKATILGPIQVIPKELQGITASLLDLEIRPKSNSRRSAQKQQIAQWNDIEDVVLRELMAPPKNQIAAIRGPMRLVSGFARTELPELKTEQPAWKTNGTYLITGGFGGIGQTLAADALSAASANVILLSRSPLPNRDAWPEYLRRHDVSDKISQHIQSVMKLETLGGTVKTIAADICNIVEMRDVIADIKAGFGTINGVIHAAGIIDDGPLLSKSPASTEAVFAAKIHGTQILHELFPDGALDWLVLCSSTSTETAPAGQIDYVSANAYLNAYAESRTGDKTRVLSINWGIWNGVGMAADAVAARNGVDRSEDFRPAGQPLLEEIGSDKSGHRIFQSKLSAQNNWVLNEHRTKDGAAILPGTAYLEMLAEALHAHGEDGAFEIEDMLFLRPVHVAEGTDCKVRVQLMQTAEGYNFELRSEVEIDARKGYVLNAQARIVIVADLENSQIVDVEAIRSKCPRIKTDHAHSGLISKQEAHLNFGPRWRVLRSMAYGQGEGLAHLSLPLDLRSDMTSGYFLHPALLDMATGWAMELIDGYDEGHLWVPMSYENCRVYRGLPSEIHSWVRLSSSVENEPGLAAFDVTICDSEGRVCVEVKNFTIKRLANASALSQSPAARLSEIVFPDEAEQIRPLSAAEERLQHNLAQGIQPAEGAEVFARALALNTPRVIVSSMDLGVLKAQNVPAHEQGASSSQKFERPELETDFVEPTNDYERTLAGFWQELLGVEQIGIEDNFFDLGGHSLIAVRLFSMVKKAYRVEFPISLLFEAPTIAKCAAAIEDRIGPADAGISGKATNTQTKARQKKRRFTHLVPMHEGAGGAKTPFFLVAGMFGNVLNLRHLAQLLGSDRPFYGLQAKGLYGDVTPHQTIGDAARDYIAEMRIAQPHGPYYLGGFSGGGITAYEIVQQLEQSGEEVALLVMLDTPLPVRRALRGIDRAYIQLQEIGQKGPKYVVEWVVNRIRWEIAKRRSTDAHMDADEGAFHNAEIEAAFLSAVSAYQVKPWHGSLALFRPPQIAKWRVAAGQRVDNQRAYLFSDNDWGQFTPEMAVFEVPGDHDSMVLEPNVRVLADLMRWSIEQAEPKIAASQKPRIHPYIEAAE